MQHTLAVLWRGRLALALGALLLPASEKAGDGGGGDAGTVEDVRPAEPDAGADTQGPATDMAPDLRPADLGGAGPEVAADLRGRDVTSAPDTAADLRPADLATRADTVAAGDAAPPNNGSVTGLTVVAAQHHGRPRLAAGRGRHQVPRVLGDRAGREQERVGARKPGARHGPPGPDERHRLLLRGGGGDRRGRGGVSSEATATPGGEWVLEELGAGDFDDVVTGGRVGRLAIKDRIHIVLLGEGYLEGELGKLHDLATHDGTRGNDVDRWVDEVFRIEPYPQFRGAFVIWYLPRASEAHLGEGTTAFGVTISSSGVNTVTAAAAPLFSALDGEGGDAFPFRRRRPSSTMSPPSCSTMPRAAAPASAA